MTKTLSIENFDAIFDAIEGPFSAVRFAFPDGRKAQMSLLTRAGANALTALIGNLRISTIGTAIYNTCVEVDDLRMRPRTTGNFIEIVNAIDETAVANKPDPKVTLTFV